MNEQRIERTLKLTTMVGRATLVALHRAIEATKDIDGAYVELGCHAGITTRYICETLQELELDRKVFAFDSFKGVPAATREDEGAKLEIPTGGCLTSRQTFDRTFANVDYPKPIVFEGWFEDTLPHNLPDEIAVAFLDGDRYESIKLSLESVLPKMAHGGFIVIHDYDKLTGAKKAVDERLEDFKAFGVDGNVCWALV